MSLGNLDIVERIEAKRATSSLSVANHQENFEDVVYDYVYLFAK
jgi:hypothetical protein